MYKLKLGITGHRDIEKVFGADMPSNGNRYDQESFEKIYKLVFKKVVGIIKDMNLKREEILFVSGMARGADEVLALLAMKLNVDLMITVPNSVEWHKNRGASNGFRAQAIYYDSILEYKKLVSSLEIKKNYKGGNYKYAALARNQSIIDESTAILSVFGYYSNGTADAIKRAEEADIYAGNVLEDFHA